MHTLADLEPGLSLVGKIPKAAITHSHLHVVAGCFVHGVFHSVASQAAAKRTDDSRRRPASSIADLSAGEAPEHSASQRTKASGGLGSSYGVD
jgi:hypothetical protein